MGEVDERAWAWLVWLDLSCSSCAWPFPLRVSGKPPQPLNHFACCKCVESDSHLDDAITIHQ
jgi:hypothetical protein